MSDAGERLRLFLAVDLPLPVLEQVEQDVAPLKGRLPGARWAPLENQHLTLKFLGGVDANLLLEISDAARGVAEASPAGHVTVTGLGAFPSAKRARVLWAGIEDRAQVLRSLASQLDESFNPLGFEAEKRAFTAHLTLARFKDPVSLGDALTSVHTNSEPVEVSRFHLYRSRLSPTGARYEILESFVLEGGPH